MKAPAGYDTSDNGSIAKYGWYPFVGALSTIILSKEVFNIHYKYRASQSIFQIDFHHRRGVGACGQPNAIHDPAVRVLDTG